MLYQIEWGLDSLKYELAVGLLWNTGSWITVDERIKSQLKLSGGIETCSYCNCQLWHLDWL